MDGKLEFVETSSVYATLEWNRYSDKIVNITSKSRIVETDDFIVDISKEEPHNCLKMFSHPLNEIIQITIRHSPCDEQAHTACLKHISKFYYCCCIACFPSYHCRTSAAIYWMIRAFFTAISASCLKVPAPHA